MQYGFYTELEDLQDEFEDDSIGWDFLENAIRYKNLSAYDFLHGYCFEFAKLLHELYKYPIECIYAEDDSLIHAYCVVEKDGNPLFIDIRGCTDDWEDFKDEFEDWMTYYDEPNHRIVQNPVIPVLSDKETEMLKDVFEAAKSFEYENRDFYNQEYWT